VSRTTDRSNPATIAEILRARADDPGTALLFEEASWSWSELVAEAEARARLLLALRREGPFHVGVLLENVPEYVFLLAGAALADAVVVGVNPTRRGAELARDITHTDCQLLITSSEHTALLEGLDLGLSPERLLVVDEPDYAERIEAGRADRSGLPAVASGDLYLLLFTAGSTGAPKAVRMSQGRAAWGANGSRFGADDVLYCVMPLFHGNALSANVFPAFATGATIALRRRFSASGFLPDVQRFGCTFFNTVGRALAFINATPPTAHDREHRLKYVLGPESSAKDREEFTRRFGVPVIEGYGSSEGPIIMMPVLGGREGTLGTPFPGYDVAVVDPDTSEERPRARFDADGHLLNPTEAIGEIVGRNRAGAFEGYWKNPEAEAERTRNGWYWSGDLGYRDEDGVFYFAGRTGDWMRVDAENLACAPIERVLLRFDGVTGAAVYPVPDVRTGDQVMAALELEPGTSFDPEAFARFVAEERDLGTKSAPRYVRIVTALPVMGTNKVDKRRLRTEGWDCADPVFVREGERYVSLTGENVAALGAELAANDRSHLLKVGG